MLESDLLLLADRLVLLVLDAVLETDMLAVGVIEELTLIDNVLLKVGEGGRQSCHKETSRSAKRQTKLAGLQPLLL